VTYKYFLVWTILQHFVRNDLSVRRFVHATFCPCDDLSMRHFSCNELSATKCPQRFVRDHLSCNHLSCDDLSMRRIVRNDLSATICPATFCPVTIQKTINSIRGIHVKNFRFLPPKIRVLSLIQFWCKSSSRSVLSNLMTRLWNLLVNAVIFPSMHKM
jgi:hypothetical protein